MKGLFVLFVLLLGSEALAACPVHGSQGGLARPQADALYLLLSSAAECPKNVLEFKNALVKNGLTVRPSLVANRGRNNPAHGSFSFFEVAVGQMMTPAGATIALHNGEFFFGHFTTKQSGTIELDQSFEPGKLMIELIIWDPAKKLFNFYELIGESSGSKWFYRGDSHDILKDNELLYRTNPPKFGKTLRCSACHVSGGPIMKEMSFPHNDWWTQSRPLVFGQAQLSGTVRAWVNQVSDASAFSKSVQRGIQKLFLSPNYQAIMSSSSLQEQLRPLFCDTEINLISSSVVSDSRSGQFEVSSQAFMNPFFGQGKIHFSRAEYEAFMRKYKLKFPENGQVDADHLWLTPVKAQTDLIQIQLLVRKGIVSDEFVYDVLAVDAQSSLLSKARCDLLKFVPNSQSRNWMQAFAINIKNSRLPATAVLYKNLTDPNRTKANYIQQSQNYLKWLQSGELKEVSFIKLLQDRNAVSEADISKNPRGQILEPGFRVIFPVPQ